MGLGPSILYTLIELKRAEAIGSSANVVEIGAQQLSNAFLRADSLLGELYKLYGKICPSFGSPLKGEYVDGVEGMSESNPSSREFWQSLGYSYAAIDFDGHRDSIALDLNRDSVRSNMLGAYDLTVNAGTTEHVANQDNAFRTIHDLTRVGGIMFHELPAGGMMNHGFMSYNPKFFWALCRENDYQVRVLRTASHDSHPVPLDIMLSNSQFAGEENYIPVTNVPDFSILAILKKQYDRPFVTPLDVPPEVMPSLKASSQ